MSFAKISILMFFMSSLLAGAEEIPLDDFETKKVIGKIWHLDTLVERFKSDLGIELWNRSSDESGPMSYSNFSPQWNIHLLGNRALFWQLQRLYETLKETGCTNQSGKRVFLRLKHDRPLFFNKASFNYQGLITRPFNPLEFPGGHAFELKYFVKNGPKPTPNQHLKLIIPSLDEIIEGLKETVCP